MIAPSTYKLGLSCCFCGGSLQIDEASHSATCPHCASVLRISRPGGVPKYYIRENLARREVKFLIDRHLKEDGQSLASSWRSIEKVYLPFWRVTGTVISIRDRANAYGDELCRIADTIPDDELAIEVKIVPRELTFVADESFGWGIDTLGVRSQVISLTPAEADFQQQHTLAPVSLTREDADHRFLSAANAIALLGPYSQKDVEVSTVAVRESLIYFPLWLANFGNREGRQIAQLDPLTKRVVALFAGEFESSPSSYVEQSGSNSVIVTPHRCPNCGDDLPVSERSITFYCSNCGRLYHSAAGSYTQLEVMIPEGVNPDDRLFPFWVYSLKDSSWPGMSRLKEALRLIQLRTDKFYLPAFALGNPSRLLRLISHYNRSRPGFKLQRQPTQHYSFTDAALTPDAGAELIAPLVAAAAATKGYHKMRLGAFGPVNAEDVRLMWLPYTLHGYFWREEITGAAIERAAVRC